jgi:hypothetical protein
MSRVFQRVWHIFSLVMLTLPTASIDCFSPPVFTLKNNDIALREFLQKFVGIPPSDRDKRARYLKASVDLNDDGKDEAIVYLIGDNWCGSGGCITLVLRPDGATYKVVSQITITRPPIRLLPSKTNGWHNLSVMVHGGGILQPYEAEIPFDGRTYATNPTVPPARKFDNANGKVVINDDYKVATLIFP